MTPTTSSVFFLEHQQHLLMLMRLEKPDVWSVPNSKTDGKEINTLLKELEEATQVKVSPKEIQYHGHFYSQLSNAKSGIHLYQALLKSFPIIKIDPDKYSQYEWTSIHAFKLYPLVAGLHEAFDILYGNRLWQRIQNVTSLIFKKGEQTLIFDAKKRFILNLIGRPGSGKGTQGEMLCRLFGIPNLSIGDLFRSEFRGKSKLGWMIQTFDEKYYPDLPDEIPIGVMTTRLEKKDCRQGFILDGFPRTGKQGDVFREVLLRETDFHVPLLMNVSETDVLERIPSRSICPHCGHQVRKFDENPWPGFCPIDAKKGEMVQLESRVGDIDKMVLRLKIFSDNKEGVLNSINRRDEIGEFHLNNSTPPREVLHQLCTHIQERLDQLAQAEKPSAISNVPLWACAMLGSFVAGAILMGKN